MGITENEPAWYFESKWPPEVTSLGFTMVPNALLKFYPELSLTPSEFLVLVNIESYRWNAKKLPFPSVKKLARRMNLSERTVTRTITSLQNERDVIMRHKRTNTSNEYSFEPLIEKLSILVEITSMSDVRDM